MNTRARAIHIGVRLLLVVGIFVLVSGIIRALDHHYTVRTIRVLGASHVKGIEGAGGSSMIFLQTQKLEEKLLETDPSLSNVRVYKVYPDTLTVSAQRLRPVAVIELADGFMYISEVGTVLIKNTSEPPSHYPRIRFYQKLFYNHFKIGEKIIYDDIHVAAQAVQSLTDLGIRVEEIDITNENMIVLHTDLYEVVVTSTRDIHEQIAVFAYTIGRLRAGGREFSRVDVRFEQPVITH